MTVGPLKGSPGLRKARGFESLFAAKFLRAERVRAERIKFGSKLPTSRGPTSGRDAGVLSSFLLGFDGG